MSDQLATDCWHPGQARGATTRLAAYLPKNHNMPIQGNFPPDELTK